MEKRGKWTSKDEVVRKEKIPGTKHSHASILTVVKREIHSYTCNDKKCRFYGKPSQQGVCHTMPEEMAQTRSWDDLQQRAIDHLTWIRNAAKKNGSDYLRALENEVVVGVLNHSTALDELVMARRKNALLKDEIRKLKKTKARRS